MEFLLRVFWYGGSTFDAWLNIASTKIATRLLTVPLAAGQMGLPSGIVFQICQGAIGLWTQLVINALYLRFKALQPGIMVAYKTQLHDVIGGLLGRRWRRVSLLFNLLTLFYVSFVQIYNCSNIVFIINNELDKRTWTSVFVAVFSLTMFIPSAHNYRIWSFIGVLTTIFVSLYLTIGSLLKGKISDVTHSSPRSFREFFTGLSGLTFLGHVPIPVEIMDAMWKPQHYNIAYFCALAFVLLASIVPTVTLNRKFGDKLLDNDPNVLNILPSSSYRQAAVVLLLVHVCINFGMYSLALYMMWEKLLRVDESSHYMKRTLSRLPVYLGLCLAALAFPFFSIVNRMADTVFATWNLYIIPCAAYNTVFWARPKREESLTGMGWITDFSINMGVIFWVVIVEFGLGFWGDLDVLLQLRHARLFAKCYHC